MEISVSRWSEIESDHPIPKLERWSMSGERMLAARVLLSEGCDVAMHRHESEQIATVIRGRVIWRLGHPQEPGYREVEVSAGTFIVLPSNQWHGVLALEESEIIDILSPPGAMGVDSQQS